MKRSTKNNLIDWLKAFVFAMLVWILFCAGLVISTKVHAWHLAEKNASNVVAATEQANN